MGILSTLFLFGPIGVTELLVILLIVVLIFGASKLPLLGKGMGEGIRNFKKGIKSDDGGQVLESPGEHALRIAKFLDMRLDPEQMSAAVDRQLYRNRRQG